MSGKIHHVRSRRILRPADPTATTEFMKHELRFEIYYCGHTFQGLIVSEVVDLHPPTPEENASANHCKRCLVALRIHKGDEHMRARGLPIHDHPLKGRIP